VHSQVSEFSRSLVHRVLCQLMFHLGHCMLDAYRHVDRFSPGGMLQAAMETEYIHHQLFAYETTETNAVFALVYDTIEQFVDEAALEGSSASGEMNELLAMTKVNLSTAKATTLSLYLCFKEPGALGSTDELAAGS
jgi:exocyst complex component 2